MVGADMVQEDMEEDATSYGASRTEMEDLLVNIDGLEVRNSVLLSLCLNWKY